MNELIKSALIGTQRHLPPAINTEDPAEQLAGLRPDLAPEELLLVRAGMTSIRRVAGTISREVPPLQAAPPESGVSPSVRLASLLAQAISPETINLLPEYVQVLQQHQIHFPHPLLPTVLDIVQPQRRDLLRPVLGERARWIARYNPNWNWVLDDSSSLDTQLIAWETEWNEGAFADRMQAFRQVRTQRPDIARDWLEAGFSKEKAEHRRKLLEVMETGLSLADLSFLEQQIKDRSEGVRNVARDLLLLLSESSISLRMRERASSLLYGKHDSSGPLQLMLTLPAEKDDHWEQDGLGTESTGYRRAAVVMISAIPTEFWLEQFGCSAEEFIEAARHGDDTDILFEGLRESLVRFAKSNEQGAAVLSAYWKWFFTVSSRQSWDGNESVSTTRLLFSMMSPVQQDQALMDLLKNPSARERLPFPDLLNQRTGTWSIELSKEYLKTTRSLLKSRADGAVYRWCETLLPAAIGLNLECLEEALSAWTLHPELVQTVRSLRIAPVEDHLRRFGDVLKIRKQFHDEAAQCAASY
ncbi:MAG TPA: DUF5691 domain-containing protein [Planctomicrobium sp.]|nr:DUF5691 domain-containing protein [Planctomicrobium sp.]